jgi:hypothetical protein
MSNLIKNPANGGNPLLENIKKAKAKVEKVKTAVAEVKKVADKVKKPATKKTTKK